MSGNYDGLTKNTWPGTWAPSSNAPIVIDTDLRGTLQSISGNVGDQLTDIPGQRLTEGMLVYIKNGYTTGAITRTGDTYYKYSLLVGEERNFATGAVPNNEANWTEANLGGGIIQPQAFGYVHTQSTASDTWLVVHGQNTRALMYQVFTSSYEHILPDEMTIVDENQILITFGAPISGFAHLLMFVSI